MRSLFHPTNLTCGILLAALLAIRPSHAQQQPVDESAQSAQTPDDTSKEVPIEGILMRLQIHLWAYQSSVPDFFADERVYSFRNMGAASVHTTTDSIFRLRRATDPSVRPPLLVESREIRAVDGFPTHGDAIQGPSIFSGGFSSALDAVSMDELRCYDYRLITNARLHRKPVLAIDYDLKPSMVDDPGCPGPEPHSGRAFIDPDDLRVLRLEMKTPKHHMPDGSVVLWTWSIDYSPVNIDGKIFWMPKTIASKALSSDNSTEWGFEASYRNYHKTNVTSRIITNLDDTTHPQP